MQITWGTLLANKEFTEKLLLAGCSKCYGMKRGNVKSSCQICCTYCSTASEILEIKRLLFGRTTRVLRELQHTRPTSPWSLASLPFVGSVRKSWSDANNQLMPPTSQLGFLCCEGCVFLFCFAALSSWDHLHIPGLLVSASKLLLNLIPCSVAEQSPLCSTCPTYSTKVIFLKTCATSACSLVTKCWKPKLCWRVWSDTGVIRAGKIINHRGPLSTAGGCPAIQPHF